MKDGSESDNNTVNFTNIDFFLNWIQVFPLGLGRSGKIRTFWCVPADCVSCLFPAEKLLFRHKSLIYYLGMCVF